MLITCHQPGGSWSTRQRRREQKNNTNNGTTKGDARLLRRFGFKNGQWKEVYYRVKRLRSAGCSATFAVSVRFLTAAVPWRSPPQQPITRQHSRILGYFSPRRARTAVLPGPSHCRARCNVLVYNVLHFRLGFRSSFWYLMKTLTAFKKINWQN